ncbi:MAG: phosphoenolpyruvate-protein phosphotransferase system enzyme [Pyrinomonadaceae bacterium]|jgi:phosphotransferase system enzyme I (PtsI)|nr:phosphoenolpyruvate-protein phosphotransferase system enzyme [Pyrinomonadaceae bacterium]
MKQQAPEIRCKGLGVSEGIVIGQVLRMVDGASQVSRWSVNENDLENERQRFRQAALIASERLRTLRDQAGGRLGKDHAYILDAHVLLLEDEKLLGDIAEYITAERVNAEWAIKVIGDRLTTLYSEIKDDYLRERGSDIEDVMQRLLTALSGARPEDLRLAEDAVIVSRDLLPSALAELDLEHAQALATDSGGWTSHTAILARGIGLPAVVGLRDFYRRTKTGDRIIVDSNRSEVILHPSTQTLAEYQKQTGQTSARRKAVPVAERGAFCTQDGVEIRLRANVELPAEFDTVEKYGACGIGLYRSEFLLARNGLTVSEEEQRIAYEAVARLAGEAGAIIRLFDLGGENTRSHFREPEKNPALGLRAIRFGLRNDSVMRRQLRAILLAGATGKLKIVLPMVTDVSEVRRVKAMIAEEIDKLKNDGQPYGDVPIGAMIEVPAAVMMAEKIAACVDFFELGTNDLVQYTLAVDRGNDEVADWFRTLHPAVLEGISRSLNAAQHAGIPAIVCGEMASTPAYAVLLIGLGATDLSMTPSAMPRVRRTLAAIDSASARSIVEECLACESADEVEYLVHSRLGSCWPQLFPASSLPKPRPSQ